MQKSAKRHAFFSDRMCAVGGLEPKVTVARTLGLLGNVPKTWKLRHYCHCTPIRKKPAVPAHAQKQEAGLDTCYNMLRYFSKN